MKLISYECPYEEYVLYRKEQDAFQSLILVAMEGEEGGLIECEVELHKIFPYTEWKIGAIYFFDRKYSKKYVNALRKRLHVEISELFQKLQVEEENIRKKYEDVPKIEILQAVNRVECIRKRARREKDYYQKYRMELAPFHKFFSVYVKKEKKKDFVTIEIKKRNHDEGSLDSLWYPDWEKDLKWAVLQHWKNEIGDVLEQEEKLMLYKNTIEKWNTIQNNMYTRGGNCKGVL